MDEIQSRLLVVIVNYKTSELLCNTLDTLLPQLDRNVDRVCVVDNNSRDYSIETLTQFIKANNIENFVELLVSEKNGGFSYGNNLAIRTALQNISQTPKFILLLNPDTLVGKNAVEELIGFMQSQPQAGIAGSKLETIDGTTQCSSFRFPSILSELDSSLRFGPISWLLSRWKIGRDIENNTALTDWVAGASMMVRSEVFKDVGLMDENYFLYFEETDFCLQAKRKGWECWYVPRSRVVHLVGQSTGIISDNINRSRRPKYWFESRQYYFLKNHGLIYTMLADLIWGIGFAIWRLRRLIQGKPDRDPERMLLDFWKNSIYAKLLSGEFSQ